MSSTENTHQSFVPYHRVSAASQVLITCTCLLAICILRSDLLLDLSSQLIGGFSGDGGLYLWLFRHNAFLLFSEPWFNTNASYPYSETLAWSDNFILPSLAGRLLLNAGLSTILSYNLILLFAMLLNGICTARFCFHLTGRLPGALFAGLLFLGSAYMASVVGHPQLQFAFWLPLSLDLLFRFLATRRFFHAFLIGACVTLTFLTTVYYALFIIVLCLFTATGILLLRPSAFSVRDLLVLICGGLAGCLPIFFFSAPYLDVQATFGERHLYEPYYFSASLLSFFSSTGASVIYSWTASWGDEESHLFSGLLPVLLLIPLYRHVTGTPLLKKAGARTLLLFCIAGIGSSLGKNRAAEVITIIFAWASLISCAHTLWLLGTLEKKLGATYLTFRSLGALFFFLILVFFVISLGPLGNPALNTAALGPYRVLYELMPGFDSMRAISRIGLLCILALSTLGALSLDLLSRQRTISPAWFAIGAVLLIAENFTYPHSREPVPEAPSALTLLKNRNRPDEVVAFLPFSGPLKENGEISSWKTFAKIQVSAMNWALDGNVRTINGYSGQQTKLMRELPRELAGFPDVRSIRALRQFAGLTHVVFMPAFAEHFVQEEFDLKLRYMKDLLELREIDHQGNYLFELTGEQPLVSLPVLMVPSFPPRQVLLQLKAKPAPTGETPTLPIFIHTHAEQNPAFTLRLKDDGEFHWYPLSLPLTGDLVRPLRLMFRGKDLEHISLGKVLVENSGDSTGFQP